MKKCGERTRVVVLVCGASAVLQVVQCAKQNTSYHNTTPPINTPDPQPPTPNKQVILTKDLEPVGKEGDLLTVPVGYLRNYLLPNGIARPASEAILEKIRKRKEDAIRAKLEEKAQAQAFANALATIGKFVIKAKAGDKDQLFAAVSKQEVIDAVYQQTSRAVDAADLTIPEIKSVGSFECSVKLHPEVTGTFTVVIQKEKNVQQGKKK